MELGLFPLHLVLFPGRPQPLHIFEPRYRTLLSDCLDGDGRFGVVAIRSGREVNSDPDTYEVGTVAEITKVERLEEGRANIIARGVDRFRIGGRLESPDYLRAVVEPVDDVPAKSDDERLARVVRGALLPYLAGLGAPDELLERIPFNPYALSWLAAAALQVDVPEQQRLLEVDSCGDRLKTALRLLKREQGIMRHIGSVGTLRPAGPVGAQLN